MSSLSVLKSVFNQQRERISSHPLERAGVEESRVERQRSRPLKMLRTVFHLLVVFLVMSVPNSLQDTEPHGSSQDFCGELKQLRELVHQQVAALAEIKVKTVYMEKENAGETKNLHHSRWFVCTISALCKISPREHRVRFKTAVRYQTLDVDVKAKLVHALRFFSS